MTIISEAGSTFVGTDQDDDAIATATHIQLEGLGGDDWLSAALLGVAPGENGVISTDLIGGEGNDRLHILIDDTSAETTWIGARSRGGAGNDLIWSDVSSHQDHINWAAGDEGDDEIRLVSTQTSPNETGINITLSASGGDGDDRITLIGSTIDLDVRFQASGGAGNDWISLKGGSSSGELSGTVLGNQGDDTLIGSTGNDTLIGGQGADRLTGRGGEDTFVFQGARGTGAAERDRIVDFTIGEDLIDVSSIDANAFKSGNQSFRFNTDPSDWQGTGRIWVEDNPDNDGSIVYASTGRKMLAINLLDGADVHASDYSASDFIL